MGGGILTLINKMFKDSKRAMAVPIVLLVILGAAVMASTLFMFRKESKQQNITNFHFLRVNFLAQSAVQHMLLKLSAFPQEAYDVGVLSLGYCPFRGIIYSESDEPAPPGKVDGKVLADFVADCNTETVPWIIPSERMADLYSDKKANNDYRVEALNVVSAYNDIGKKQSILTAQVVGIGESKMEKGNQEIRKERIEKIVQLTGNN